MTNSIGCIEKADVILITGAECGSTQAKARRAGLNLREDLAWQPALGTPDVMIGDDVAMSHEIERAIGERTRAVLLCSPNNPTGTVYTDEELDYLFGLVEGESSANITPGIGYTDRPTITFTPFGVPSE